MTGIAAFIGGQVIKIMHDRRHFAVGIFIMGHHACLYPLVGGGRGGRVFKVNRYVVAACCHLSFSLQQDRLDE